MCGFVGAFGPSASNLSSHLESSIAAIRHRGPNDSGSYESPDQSLLLGHLRLSILDLSAASHQPMLNDRGYALAYNGEVYNHLDLRRTIDGETFRTHGDTETILKGLIRRGPALLDDAVGMFAGAFYQEKERILTLFRDSLGIKPLYTATLEDSTVVFGSEVKAILALTPELRRRVSPLTLRTYLTYENFRQDESLFEGVQPVKPGSCWLLRAEAQGKISVRKSALRPPSDSDPIPANDEELREEIRARIKRSVKQHMMADVPLGVYLSGGIDSSTVATLAARSTPALLGFTGYFESDDAYYDERQVSRDVAKAGGIDLMEVLIRPSDLEENLDAVVYALDEPRMGMGSFSQYMVARVAAQHRKVILAGHGGDELFAGYPVFKAFWLLQNGLTSRRSWSALLSLKGKELPWLVSSWISYHRRHRLDFAPELFPEARKTVAGDPENLTFSAIPTDKLLEQLQDYFRRVYLPGLLVVEDKISMAHSLETRVPLWSQEIVAWAARIPVSRLMPEGQLKGLLKQAVTPLLPPSVLSAPKRGFPTPLRLWFRQEHVGFLKSRLLDGHPAIYSLVSRREVERLIDSHHKRPLPFALDERRAHRLWMLLCLESWFRQYRVEAHA